MVKNNIFQLIGGFSILISSIAYSADEIKLSPADPIAQTMIVLNGRVSIAEANDNGEMRWATWEDKSDKSKGVYLSLYSIEKKTAKQLWSTSWPDAYRPVMRVLTEWTWHDHPTVAVTMQFGAAAAQVDLYGLDGNNKAIRLAEILTSDIEWAVNKDEDTLLIASDATPNGLKAKCYGWDEASGKLVSKVCK
jgi:hypothetical protein